MTWIGLNQQLLLWAMSLGMGCSLYLDVFLLLNFIVHLEILKRSVQLLGCAFRGIFSTPLFFKAHFL
jgi:hypothetical protein